MKKLLRKSLLASVIITTSAAAGIVYFSDTLLTEDKSSDFSTSNDLPYNVLSRSEIEDYSTNSTYIADVKGNSQELKSNAKTEIRSSVNEFNEAISFTPREDIPSATNDPWLDHNSGVDGGDPFIDGLPTDQPDDISSIVPWIEGEAGQTLADLSDTITSIADIITIPSSAFGTKVKELHGTYETYFYNNVTRSTEYRDYWNDTDNIEFDGAFDYDPKSATWTDWDGIPFYFWDILVATNPIAGQTFTSPDDAKTYFANQVYSGLEGQLLENTFSPSLINADDVQIDLLTPISPEDIQNILDSFVDGNIYDPITLPTIDLVIDHIVWTDIEHVKSIYEWPAFSSVPKVTYDGGEVVTYITNSVNTMIHNAVVAAMGDNAGLVPIVEESIHEALDASIATMAGQIEVAVNAYITAVANIDQKITEFNLLIDQVNQAIVDLNLLIDGINDQITAINVAIKELEGQINDALLAINNGLTVDWGEITGLVNAINGFIENINTEITALNAAIVAAIEEINTQIENAFGELDMYFVYTNDTIAYIYESIWYYTQMQIVENAIDAGIWHVPDLRDPVLTNRYQDSTGLSPYNPGDGVSTLESSEFPFTEVSITDADGTTTPVDVTNPIYTNTATDTYSASYTISVREGGDYEAFDPNGIKIYSCENALLDTPTDPTTADAVEHTFTWEKNPTPLATGRSTAGDAAAPGTSALAFPDAATYDVYEYTFTVNDLKAGQEYIFYMEANNFADAEVDGYFNGIENSVRVNNTPVLHFMNNDTTLSTTTTPEITEVTAAATFDIQDDSTYWNIEEDDIQVETTVTGETAPIAEATNTFTDGDGTNPATLDLTYTGLIPDTSYTTTISVRPYDADDIQWINEDGLYVPELTVEWKTLPWKAPQPPVIEITDPGKDDLADKKQTRQIDYTITTPGADELTGQDTTVITSIDVMVGEGDALTPGAEPTGYTNAGSITTIANNGGATEAVEISNYLIEGLTLGTQYSTYFTVNFEGRNDPTHTGTVDSNIVVFTTEGLDPALPPYFGLETDETDGFTFVSATTDSITLAFDFTDPMTPAYTTNTKIESIDYYVEESATGITDTSVPYTDVTVTYDGGVAPDSTEGFVDNNTADVNYTGQVTFNNLNPNMDYDFRMDLNSNAIPTIDSDPDSDKITVPSVVSTGKTLKLDALPPEWDVAIPFEWDSRTENTITFKYKFHVPENDLTHKNTLFDSIAVYVGAEGASTLTEISDVDPGDKTTPFFVITPNETGTEVTAPAGATNGDYSGTIVFKNLSPNTTYQFQLGIRSYWYDDDYPTLTSPEIDMPEVFSPIRVEATAKLSAKGPWFDTTTGGLEFLDSIVVAPATEGEENTIQATIGYKFYLPPTDDDYFDTLFNNEFKILVSSTYEGGEAEYEATDFSIEQTTTGEITDIGEEHSFTVLAEDGTEYTTTTTTGQMYSGIITLNNLHPEETYTTKLVVSTESANPDTEEDGTTPKDIIPDITSNALSFDSHTLPPMKPYFGKETDETDGVSFVKNSDWTDTSMSFTFDFTIPTKEHGYEEGLLYGVNVYFGSDSSALSLVTEGPDYTITWNKTGTNNGDGTYSAGLYAGTIKFTGLDANTTYFVQMGIDSNYYVGVDETNLEEVLSPIVSGTTSSTKAVPPVILDAAVTFDKDKSRFILGMDVQTFNGESDPLGSVADTLNDVIHVGKIETDADGNLLDDVGEVVTGDLTDQAVLDSLGIFESDYYVGTGGYKVKTEDNGAGVETVHYDINLLTNKIPFESVIKDMIVILDWSDDGSSYDPQSGSVRFKVPDFETPPIETITPQFESVYTTNVTTNTADVTYNIGLLDPSVVPNPDDDGNSSYIDEPEIWQTETVVNRISVREGITSIIDGGSTGTGDKASREVGPVDPDLPPIAPTAEEAIYDSDSDLDFTGELFGTFTLDNLTWGSRYEGVTVYAEYDAIRPTDVGVEGAEPVMSGTIAYEIPPFDTEFVGTLTPDIDIIDDTWNWIDPLFPVERPEPPTTIEPPVTVDPGSEDGGVNVQRIIWILLLILFTGIVIAAVLYPMLKND